MRGDLMRDAVIVDAVRTPIGKRGGSLAEIHPADLSAHVLNALAERNALNPATVEDVVWGCVTQIGDQSGNLGRVGVLAAGWPETVPGTTIDRKCGSSQQAVSFAAASVIAGYSDVAVAGGAESMSRVQIGSNVGDGQPYPDSVLQRYDVERFHQAVGAELVVRKWGFTRTQVDAYSARSHERTAAAIDTHAFDGQLAPLAGLDQDEGLRRGTTVDTLAGLRTAFRADGVITAGNSSQISDGAGAVLITTSDVAAARGWTPIARIHTSGIVGSDPVLMLTGPIPAPEKAPRRSGLPIAVGHPLGGSGAILMTRLAHHMKAHGIRYGLQTMCEGGGMANATILELL